ncbi:hexosaminidase D-like [Ruditapes philippinarum]|uniref:hexosaminidase D-like n=1 Tax=Ruditapes philippinarum TaxID=129788 RepID=UPI00295BA037|nr:hexosaminidase D-like [Ruditapes philippinarum]
MALTNAHKLVHLDLKGAAPRIEYLQVLFPILKKNGATGLLLEYEDMFPYVGQLEELSQRYAYSKDNIAELLQLAEDNSLTVIPLIQTFGHFEFVLKHEKFKSLCELEGYPSALCPSNADSLTVISMIIDQVMTAHPAIQYFHIGGDEVYHLGVCERCKRKMLMENWTVQQLFFAHVRAVCLFIKEKYPHITIIMWDDMLRFLELPVLAESGLGSLVEIMVWHYLPSFLLPPDIWDRFSKVFSNIWVASAFKGATGACMYATNIMYHVDNHLTWLSVLDHIKSKFENIKGIAITGWQRYDHYAILCELLPQALPSLLTCLAVINRETFTSSIHSDVTQQLKFQGLLPLNPFEGKDIPACEFPGSDIYKDTIELLRLEAAYEDFLHSEGRLSWMNEYHMRRNFTNPMHLEALLAQAVRLLNGLKLLHKKFETSLKVVFFPDTVDEWCGVYLKPKIDKMTDIVELARNQDRGSSLET